MYLRTEGPNTQTGGHSITQTCPLQLPSTNVATNVNQGTRTTMYNDKGKRQKKFPAQLL